MSDLATKRDQLLGLLRRLESCAVAFSAGVDSAVLAKAATLALGPQTVAVTGVSPSLAEGELQQAREVARLIGIRHLEINTSELELPKYAENAPDRCYHCRIELYRQLQDLRPSLQVEVIVNGANADDLLDYRPGTRAATEQAVRSPLAECGLTKADVRAVAGALGLPNADKPAAPCLASRIPHFKEVTPEKLSQIDRAEAAVRALGFSDCRVRHHDDVARLELTDHELARAADPEVRAALVEGVRAAGFRFVALDLVGIQSGAFTMPLVTRD